MINYFENSDIDNAKWDKCILNSRNGMIYAFSWYLDIVCPGWDALIEGDYKFVMPLPNKKKYGIKYLFPPSFAQQLGIFSYEEVTEEKVALFLSSIPKEFKYIELNLNEQNPYHALPMTLFAKEDFMSKPCPTFLLDLSPDYATIASHYSTQTVRNLKKAGTFKYTIASYLKPKNVIRLFRHNKGKEFGYSKAYYDTLETLMEEILKRKMGKSIGTYTTGMKLCAGAFFVESKGRIIFLFSGADSTAYQTHAMTLLINSVIEENSGRNLIFDFEGSSYPNLAHFYKGFGSKEAFYNHIRRNNLAEPLKTIKEFQLKRKAGI
jgi:hypothetical protein